jgi:hypothetical protein
LITLPTIICINADKILVIPVVLGIMPTFNNWSAATLVQLAVWRSVFARFASHGSFINLAFYGRSAYSCSVGCCPPVVGDAWLRLGVTKGPARLATCW